MLYKVPVNARDRAIVHVGRSAALLGAVGTVVASFAPWNNVGDAYYGSVAHDGSTEPILAFALVLAVSGMLLALMAANRPAIKRWLLPFGILFPFGCVLLIGIAGAASGIGDASIESTTAWGLPLLACSLLIGGIGFALLVFGSGGSE